jgi:hypothetical protein
MQKLLIVCTLCAVPVAALGQSFYGCGSTPVVSTEDKGRRIELVLDGAAVAKTPTWTPTKGEPPLSVSKAAAVALAWAKVRYKRYDSVEITELSLKEFSCSSVSDRWYYQVEFAPIMDGNRLFGSGNWAAVLMDGTVVGPIETTMSSNKSLERARDE